MKQQLFDLLTKNRNSKINSTHNLGSILNIDFLKKNHSHDQSVQKLLTTAYIEDDSNTKCIGAYFLQHDKQYVPDHCFHIVRINSLLNFTYRLYPGYLRVGLKYLSALIT